MITVTLNFGIQEMEQVFREYVMKAYPDLDPGMVSFSIDTQDRGGGQYVSSVSVFCSTKGKKPGV